MKSKLYTKRQQNGHKLRECRLFEHVQAKILSLRVAFDHMCSYLETSGLYTVCYQLRKHMYACHKQQTPLNQIRDRQEWMLILLKPSQK